jgi:hypothetical protein
MCRLVLCPRFCLFLLVYRLWLLEQSHPQAIDAAPISCHTAANTSCCSRANGKSYVCDVNGFSFVKNSHKYYDDCAKILGNMILRHHKNQPQSSCSVVQAVMSLGIFNLLLFIQAFFCRQNSGLLDSSRV